MWEMIPVVLETRLVVQGKKENSMLLAIQCSSLGQGQLRYYRVDYFLPTISISYYLSCYFKY